MTGRSGADGGSSTSRDDTKPPTAKLIRYLHGNWGDQGPYLGMKARPHLTRRVFSPGWDHGCPNEFKSTLASPF